MKKLLWLLTLLLLVGCTTDSEDNKIISGTKLKSYFPDEDSSKPIDGSEEGKEESFKLPFEEIDKNTYPFAVGVDALVKIKDNQENKVVDVEGTDFVAAGTNIPNKLTIGKGRAASQGVCLTIHADNEKDLVYPVTFTQIPTKELMVIGGSGTNSYKRPIRVNTEITLQAPDINDENSEYSKLEGHKYYLFYNGQGTISLVTENFAGNVEAEDADVMMEYVKE
ncbi:hypothetical protein [Vagococcus zengguangii]|uniref:Uncharacterized protein n=1 Tax=Vagococcus zengguangii TaxID=2571750 RepID=A0A4D7CQS5_9ENTE|nr:hypothetical protein [Vagococcus zengguangii]QCI86515.1 hypothetical protein FA707_05825 [Vagococcus zengguangii]TLG81235.1 hypothetical protein FE258_01790 [Vagococcus zengguangii]